MLLYQANYEFVLVSPILTHLACPLVSLNFLSNSEKPDFLLAAIYFPIFLTLAHMESSFRKTDLCLMKNYFVNWRTVLIMYSSFFVCL